MSESLGQIAYANDFGLDRPFQALEGANLGEHREVAADASDSNRNQLHLLLFTLIKGRGACWFCCRCM